MTYGLFDAEDLTGIRWFPRYRWDCDPEVDTTLVAVPPMYIGSRTHYENVRPVPEVRGVDQARTFSDDFYDRIHASTFELNIGTVVSNQIRVLTIWNAWRPYEKRLIDVDLLDAEGIELSGQPVPPLNYAPLQARSYTVTVTKDGPPIVDATVLYTFEDGTVLDVSIIGRRAVAWTATVDWNSLVLERVEFLTDVLEMQYGREQRRRLRIGPRKTYEFDFILYDQGRRIMENSMLGWGVRPFIMPCWPEGQDVPVQLIAGVSDVISMSTKGRPIYPGSLIMLLKGPEKYELLEVDSMDADSVTLKGPVTYDWPAGSRVYPTISATLEEGIKLDRLTDNITVGTAALRSIESVDLWNVEDVPEMEMYLGLPVITERPNESDDPVTGYERVMVMVESQTGKDFIDDISDLARITQTHAWLLQGEEAITKFKSLLYYLKGKLSRIWVPTFRDDVDTVGDIEVDSTQLTIHPIGFVDFALGREGRKHLRIETSAGVFYREITGALVVEEGERLFFNDPLPATPKNQIVCISFMMCARLQGDSVEIAWHYENLIEVSATFKAVENWDAEESD